MKTINFEINGKPYSLVTGDDWLSELCASDIITGKSYPFPEWKVDPKVVLDIGGHVGEFSILAKIHWPKAEVHCFEPNPEIMGLLKENAVRYQFLVHECAVSNFNGPAELKVSGYGAVANSLVSRPNQTCQAMTVEVMDAQLLVGWKPNVLKVDAEQVELTILDRMFPALGKIELIYLEFHTEEDRHIIDAMLRPTHSLFHAHIGHKDQGELMYVRRKT